MQFNTDYYKLPNGVRVLLVPMPGVESATTLVLAKTGSRNESEEEAGISHILEHMVLKATKKFPTQMMLSSTIDSMGAEHNAFTGKEYTGYYITAASMHQHKSIELLADVVTEPLLLEENLNTEKGVIVEEYHMYQDLPIRRAPEEFENLLWQKPMGRFIEGTPETINSCSAHALRQYLNKWYKGGNLLVVIAGKIEKEAKKWIEEYFGEVEKGEMLPYTTRAVFGKEKKKFIEKKTEQAHFVLGYPGIAMTDERRYALSLAQIVLGGPMSSRLFNEIREKRGLAYYVRAEDEAAYDTGYLAVRAGVKLDKLNEAMEVVKNEFYRLADTFGEKDLKLAKDYALGKLPLSLESSMDVAQFFGMRALALDEVRQPFEEAEKLRSVTVADVGAVVREIVKEEELRSVVVGPRDL